MTATEILKKYFGYDTFRPGQEALIEAILNGEDALGIMPTGAGKSICYQVPALLLPGITLVISPLISLMKDQVRALNEAGIHAAYINSSLSEGQIRKAMELACAMRYKIIYVAPERLLTPLFLDFARRTPISMVTVDEAHCISQWGQDFRPSYRNIVDFVAQLPVRPVLGAFTATATVQVRKDIEASLCLKDPRVLVTGFDRENLYFEVRTGNKDQELLAYVKEHLNESGIIYCATRKNVEAVCAMLQKEGIAATRYHAGLFPEERKENQDQFIYDEKAVMVATNAFGMGIDKSNVRYVFHYNMPQSIENYYQEAGRAGRDGARAECILLYSPQDVRINQFLLEEKELPEDLSVPEQRELRVRDMERLRKMDFYATTKDCLRSYILQYFGEEAPEHCANCGNCLQEFETVDVTDACRDIFRCIQELPRAYGAGTIAAILHGSHGAKIRETGFDRLQSYSTQQTVSEFRLKEILKELQVLGYLQATLDKYALLVITPQAEAFLREEQEIMMKLAPEKEKKPKKAQTKKRPRGKAEDLDAASWELFEQLRTLRMELAKKQKVPPYMVFSDKTLVDLCLRRPSDQEEMLEVSGVGEAKLAKYGEAFLQVIQRERSHGMQRFSE